MITRYLIERREPGGEWTSVDAPRSRMELARAVADLRLSDPAAEYRVVRSDLSMAGERRTVVDDAAPWGTW